jgi:hypothetical protein
MNSGYALAVRGLAALGALLALAATGLARRSQGSAAVRSLLKAACVAGLIALVVTGAFTERWLFADPAATILAAGIGTGIWSLVLYPTSRRVHYLGSLLLATMLVIYCLVANVARIGLQVAGWPFELAEFLHSLAVGGLLLGSICLLALRPRVSPRFVLPTLSIALLLETIALTLYALGAQLTWGSYWSWDPIECWRLAGWLAMAIPVLGVYSLDWGRRRACWALGVASGFIAFISIGSSPLVLYLMRW